MNIIPVVTSIRQMFGPSHHSFGYFEHPGAGVVEDVPRSARYLLEEISKMSAWRLGGAGGMQ
jgi:hypothetical protein